MMKKSVVEKARLTPRNQTIVADRRPSPCRYPRGATPFRPGARSPRESDSGPAGTARRFPSGLSMWVGLFRLEWCQAPTRASGGPVRAGIHRRRRTGMAKYLLLLIESEEAYASAGEAELNATMEAHNAFGAEVTELGASILSGEALQPTPTAT